MSVRRRDGGVVGRGPQGRSGASGVVVDARVAPCNPAAARASLSPPSSSLGDVGRLPTRPPNEVPPFGHRRAPPPWAHEVAGRPGGHTGASPRHNGDACASTARPHHTRRSEYNPAGTATQSLVNRGSTRHADSADLAAPPSPRSSRTPRSARIATAGSSPAHCNCHADAA